MTRNSRRGFVLFLAFMVTTVLFFLGLAALNVSVLSLDSSRSAVLETIGFHAADGGLEKGLAKLSASFGKFNIEYDFSPRENRKVSVRVTSESVDDNLIDLLSVATVTEGGRIVSVRRLRRSGIRKSGDLSGAGTFSEEI